LGFQFPLLDGLAIPMCFLADHGNVARRAGLTIVASEADGQGEPVKLAHLLGKDLYNVLENTANPDLRMGFRLLQSSSLLVVGSGTVKECILVPRNAFINTLASPIQGFIMEPKKSIKELERHLARLEKEIEGRNRTCKNPRTGQSTTIPGQATQEEQRIVDQISWEITS
jgi:hypothetical protein